ncbi:hypothetical protein L0F63_005701 [Massospora cicadina]|nr:hypothetical protein L0F63_005701 [Massospora cicadina]
MDLITAFAPIPPDVIDLGRGPVSNTTQIALPPLRTLFPDLTDSSSPTLHLRIKPRRKRARKEQVSILMKSFQADPFPNSDTRLRLATYLRMTPRAVQIWFQNKRQSLKSKSTLP